ncbi:YccF domain-containing protein, partial [Clostridium perfringens]|nr:YccF domain-containing protein [Clostridium perfringens]
MSTIGNLIWLLFGGIIIALEYFVSSVVMMITIIGIPFGLQTL